MNLKNNILDYTYDKLEQKLITNGYKSFVAKQIFDWVYKKHILDFDNMKNISKNTIEWLKDNFYILDLKINKLLEDNDGTIKFLFELEDGNKIESVIMNFEYGNSICVTTQIGCNMGCKFCASGQLKKIRNLTSGEIVAQVLYANIYLASKNKTPLRNIVIMGIGEPLDNYDNVRDFINIVRNDLAIGIGSRKITLSTCGIVNKFDDFINDFPQVGLAISLHAPNNEIRNEIMPINQAFSIEELIKKSKEYTDRTNRRITFEYIMLKGINDSPKNAHQLVSLLKDLKPELFNINLIPYNNVDNVTFKRSDNIRKFYEIVREYNIIITVRQEKGTSIDGACGQLRARDIR